MEELGDLDFAVRRELDGLTNGIQQPTQDHFASRPAAVPFEEFLEGYCLVSLMLGDVGLCKDAIDSVEEVAS